MSFRATNLKGAHLPLYTLNGEVLISDIQLKPSCASEHNPVLRITRNEWHRRESAFGVDVVYFLASRLNRVLSDPAVICHFYAFSRWSRLIN